MAAIHKSIPGCHSAAGTKAISNQAIWALRIIRSAKCNLFLCYKIRSRFRSIYWCIWSIWVSLLRNCVLLTSCVCLIWKLNRPLQRRPLMCRDSIWLWFLSFSCAQGSTFILLYAFRVSFTCSAQHQNERPTINPVLLCSPLVHIIPMCKFCAEHCSSTR